MLLARDAIEGIGDPLVRAVLLRMLDLSGAAMRAFDEMEDDVGVMEEIVFGGRRAPAAREGADA